MSSRREIIHVLPSFQSEASGPSYSVAALTRTLAARGNEVTLLSVGAEEGRVPGVEHLSEKRFRKDYARIPILNRLWFSNGLLCYLKTAAACAGLVHSHSLWLMPNVYPAWAVAKTRIPFVISPRGTLSPVALKRSRLVKRAFWAAYQGTAVSQAVMLHATSEREYRDIRAFGLTQPVAIIPNGIEVPETAASRPPGQRRRLLYLGRLHPIKGLDSLLAAWGGIERRFADWELRLVGPQELGHGDSLKRMAEEIGLKQVSFADARYGEDKAAEYRAANLYVLPSRSENFAVSVAEALGFGLPVITTTGTPWSGLIREECGWWVAPDRGGLTGALESALAVSPDTLVAMGRRGRDWMARDFSWTSISTQMEAAYTWVVRGGAVPECVRLN